MALDRENTNPAYVCGRLFSVLEEIQRKASGFNLNRTIKDAYFSSASTRPAVIFPKLIQLSQHHLAKLGNARYLEEDVAELINKLNGCFPSMMTLTEQGEFMIGYYQQKSFTEEEKKKAKETQEV